MSCWLNEVLLEKITGLDELDESKLERVQKSFSATWISLDEFLDDCRGAKSEQKFVARVVAVVKSSLSDCDVELVKRSAHLYYKKRKEECFWSSVLFVLCVFFSFSSESMLDRRLSFCLISEF